MMILMMIMTMMIYFKERGVYLMNSGRTGAAIASFSQALRTNDQDLRCWILRSNCYIRSILHGSFHRHFIWIIFISRLNQIEKAIKDSDAALEINSNCTRALTTKAEALYCQGSFEMAMVLFSRCSVLAKTNVVFRGINKSRSAIINTLRKVDFSTDMREAVKCP